MIRRTLPLALVLAAAAACGGNQSENQQQSAGEVGDSLQANRVPPTPSVDSIRRMDENDSGYVKAQQRLDSLRAAGVGPADGIDSAASRAGNTLTNDPTADTMVYRKMRVPPKAKP